MRQVSWMKVAICLVLASSKPLPIFTRYVTFVPVGLPAVSSRLPPLVDSKFNVLIVRQSFGEVPSVFAGPEPGTETGNTPNWLKKNC